jgi:hypothetical protein
LAAAGQVVALEQHQVAGLIRRVEALYTDLLIKKQGQ